MPARTLNPPDSPSTRSSRKPISASEPDGRTLIDHSLLDPSSLDHSSLDRSPLDHLPLDRAQRLLFDLLVLIVAGTTGGIDRAQGRFNGRQVFG